jgi:hypothetical protein
MGVPYVYIVRSDIIQVLYAERRLPGIRTTRFFPNFFFEGLPMSKVLLSSILGKQVHGGDRGFAEGELTAPQSFFACNK